MTLMRTILGLVVFLTLVALPAPGQTTYHFDRVLERDWDLESNWSPFGKPEAGDTAIIVGGHRCLVEDGDQAADVVEVQSGAALTLVSKRLDIHDSGAALTVNGDLCFKSSIGPRAPLPRLYFFSDATITGGGTLNARKAPGYATGLIEAASQRRVTVDADLTLAGSLRIQAPYLHLFGTLLVDSDEDTLELGHLSGSTESMYVYNWIPSVYRVSAGSIVFRTASIHANRGLWDICGGTIHITADTNVGADYSGLFILRITNSSPLKNGRRARFQ